MGIEDIKTAIKALTVDERRNVALYILELEKEHLKQKVGPQISKDMNDVSKVVQDAMDKLKKFVIKN